MEDGNKWKLGVEKVRQFLPHRQPFLMVDKVLEIHPTGELGDLSPSGKVGTRVVALKNVSYNEPHFAGHFPTYAIMPGVLIVETMAQTAAFSIYPHMDLGRIGRDFQCILVGVDGARFRKPVHPGDTLRIETTVSKTRGWLWAFQCQAAVDGVKVAEAEILANLIVKEGTS